MRKETILAIFAGISIGLIFAFGSWRLIKNIKRDVPILTSRPTPVLKTNLFVSLDKLTNFDVIIDEEYTLTGLTNPNSNVLVITEEKDFLSKAKEDGSFEITVTFPSGLSEVKINNTKINLVFSSEFPEKGATSYVGTVTDITAETIQIKDPQGEIKQASTEKDTKYINILKKNVEVKSTDLAIGDYIVAMGFINGNKVLKTKRILITSPMEENKFEAKKIVIETISKTKINDIILPKKWIGPNVKDLEIGQEIIVTGKAENDIFSLRSIFAPTL
ncbi:MAG: hypothetical protein UR39_C0002G0112 [Candidatus Woesebacteria bacterium GW2011_GWA1_33_30]|uniref:DUF5666 domain-containing protein n=1 Tax=Candidatus Woesebacteria bacterium GW2011_GWA2_33_28 TaxID=1618561 RepID=A0A0F9ZUS4_9BACT|nr:MAG: hypothetical protein UR38_C0002G0112 [Candidatus Woesebacteria bacterium GW2011_GWA2_33_28]KKP48822.1 MAG: hypothetical protein UR39_C0002G0112 [Candidatus Woesebacteria bacterium GW2011_GWA1_33_30]KKP50095.1 MAG: hypothetical protein UR40_C0002G0112 [Microgenomates group bacterium GW2011_GWC1_33_32]KKP51866.1 MAG: hypothetical protein UR44_C0006G0112 [Candidatus Woesebacteria bacterium GW2011_GWB1_33_38]KKP57675.1 MAG: hypothetical protein UR48_C0012G0003 [Microgenomates group bacteriu